MSAFWLWVIAKGLFYEVGELVSISDGQFVRNRAKIAPKPLILHDLSQTGIRVRDGPKS